MKRWLPIAFLSCIVAFLACNRPVETRHGTSLPSAASPQLQAIDSLMWRQPDSAFAQLRQFVASPQADSLDEFNVHYCQLLISELLYKNYCGQSNREELLRAVAYFDSIMQVPEPVEGPSFERNVFLTARAHYINGAGYYERDSVVEACKEYLKALDVMEGHFEERELVGKKAQFISLSYTRIAVLYSDFYLHEQAIYFAKLSLLFYDRYASSPNHVAWILNEIGSQYDLMEELDSADYYYQKAATIINDSNLLMYRDIVTHLAILQYKKGDFSEEPIHRLQELISKSENDEETLARYSVLGELYYHEKQIDSAWKYLSVVFRKTSNDNSKRQAAALLVNICKTKGNESDTEDYTNFLIPFANQEEGLSDVKSQLTELYKTWCLVKVERQHFIQSKKWSKMAFAGTALLICIVLTTSSLYLRNRKQKHVLETQIETERQTHKTQQAALAGRLKRSNAALKQKIETELFIDSEKTPSCTVPNNYVDEPICQHILAKCNDEKNPIKSTVPITAYANIALSDAQKAQLKDAAIRHYSRLFEKLRQLYPELKEKDLYYCYLSLLGLDNTQIAVLLQNSNSTIWGREKRLQKIFGSNDKIAIVLNGMINNQ